MYFRQYFIEIFSLITHMMFIQTSMQDGFSAAALAKSALAWHNTFHIGLNESAVAALCSAAEGGSVKDTRIRGAPEKGAKSQPRKAEIFGEDSKMSKQLTHFMPLSSNEQPVSQLFEVATL